MRPVVAAAIGLVAGLALGLILARIGLPPSRGEPGLAVVLETELAREREIGEALRDRVEDLETQVAQRAPADPALREELDEGVARVDPIASSGSEVSPGDAAEPGAAQGAGFDESRLLELGYHASDVERLRRAWESLELERLYLQNERARSPSRNGQHWLRMRALENETLEELGESDYDALLYAAGNKNRVTVTRVFPESPAEDAGFALGDQVTAYGDKPIFRMHVLKGETTRCELGANVAVTVLRDGQERRIWTPCGPLGIQLQMVNAPPR